MVVLDGAKIVRLRASRAWTQEGLAEKTRELDQLGAGISTRVVWDAEKSKSVSPRTHLLIARAFGVAPWTLLPAREQSRRMAMIALPAVAIIALFAGAIVGTVRMEQRAGRSNLYRTPRISEAPYFDDMRGIRVLTADTTLRHDLLCNDLTIRAGVTLYTDGHNVFCSGAFINNGTIITGYSGYGDYLGSYGGTGGEACDSGAARAGSQTLGTGVTVPPLSRSLLEHWYQNGLTTKLAGAAGSSHGNREALGAYGLYVQARSIDAGRILATGQEGASGGGGGVIVLAFARTLHAGVYDVSGGRGAVVTCAASSDGGAGRVLPFAYGPRSPIDPVADAGFIAGVWHRHKTAVTSVQFSGSAGDETVVVHGYGFGPSPFQRPYQGFSADFRIADPTEGRWEAGYAGDKVPLIYRRWDDGSIEVSNVDARPGDCIVLGIWNPQTGSGAAWGGNVPPIPTGAPRVEQAQISSDGEMTLVGSGFGQSPLRTPFADNSYLVFFGDLAYHPRNGNGPSVQFIEGDKWTNTKLLFEYWSNTRIEIAGFTGAPLPPGMYIEPGDPINLIVWNSQRHLATAWGGFAR